MRSRLCLSWLLVIAASCTSTTPYLQPPPALGEAAGASGSAASAAVNALRQRIEKDPADVDAWYNLGVEEERAGNAAAAVSAYQKALLIEPRHIAAAVNLAAVHRMRGAFAEAKGVLSDLFDSGVDDPRARTDLAVLHRLSGDLDRSLRESQEVLRRFGLVYGAKLNAGLVYLAWGKHEMALTIFNEMVGEFPDDSRVHFSIGRTLEALDNPVAAAAEYERAVSLDTQAFEAINNLGVIRLLRRDFEGARSAFQSAVSANALYAPAWVNLGIAERNLGRFREADVAYRRALEIQPGNRVAFWNLGLLYDDYQDRVDAALQTWQAFLSRFGSQLSSEERAEVDARLAALAQRRTQMRATEADAAKPAPPKPAPAPVAPSAEPQAPPAAPDALTDAADGAGKGSAPTPAEPTESTPDAGDPADPAQP